MPPPKLIVFDLDFTLWDCGGTWCDCLSPPFSVSSRCNPILSDSGVENSDAETDEVVDASGRRITLYPDVLNILALCDEANISLALASRTEQPGWARQLIRLLGIDHRFAFSEIYPASKLKHFAALRKSSSIDYQDMLFFDDEMRNITECSTLGVTCVHVSSGMTARVFQSGLRRFDESAT